MFVVASASGKGKSLPTTGAVLGIDVGWSETRRSSAACTMSWNDASIEVSLCRFTAQESDVRTSLTDLLVGRCLVAAIDGPLARGLPVLRRYRIAESMLTRAFWRTIGKPGQSSSPNGIKLNTTANKTAEILRQLAIIDAAPHGHAILDEAIVEAFPTAFLGAMLGMEEVARSGRQARSDTYYKRLTESVPCRLTGLIQRLLPGRRLSSSLSATRNHDERAAVVCAATALAVAAGEYTAVGDKDYGWIILPPRALQEAPYGLQPWAEGALQGQAFTH
jgi:predicted RNase H-like nuclease